MAKKRNKVVTSGADSTVNSGTGSGITRPATARAPSTAPRGVQPRSRTGQLLPAAPAPEHRKIVDDIFAGKPVTRALRDGGYSEYTARMGMHTIRRSNPLAAAWRERAALAGQQPLPSMADRQARWWELALEDMDKRSNAAVPILSMVGRAVGTLAPENQTVVQIAALSGVPMPGYQAPADTGPDALPVATAVTK